MFTRADFNPRCDRRLAFGRIRMIEGSGRVHRAELIRFACGDYAWYCWHFIAWPECADVVTFIHVDVSRIDAPFSYLTEAPHH